MLVVVDESVNIHDYAEVIRVVSDRVDPQQDIFFSQGPMDVLDHSCSKFAFGGKMCVDATRKYGEELRSADLQTIIQLSNTPVPVSDLKQRFPEIQDINISLLQKEISVVFISVKKNRKNHIRELNEKLFRNSELRDIKFIIYVEHTVDVNDIKDVVWRWSNNFDPRRDSNIIPAEDANGISHVGFDGTRKTKAFDDFDRDWPNIICSDEVTIEEIDKKWSSLGLGEFLPSPSLKYRKQLYNGGAVVLE